jgi:hypothetical protein
MTLLSSQHLHARRKFLEVNPSVWTGGQDTLMLGLGKNPWVRKSTCHTEAKPISSCCYPTIMVHVAIAKSPCQCDDSNSLRLHFVAQRLNPFFSAHEI